MRGGRVFRVSPRTGDWKFLQVHLSRFNRLRPFAPKLAEKYLTRREIWRVTKERIGIRDRAEIVRGTKTLICREYVCCVRRIFTPHCYFFFFFHFISSHFISFYFYFGIFRNVWNSGNFHFNSSLKKRSFFFFLLLRSSCEKSNYRLKTYVLSTYIC